MSMMAILSVLLCFLGVHPAAANDPLCSDYAKQNGWCTKGTIAENGAEVSADRGSGSRSSGGDASEHLQSSASDDVYGAPKPAIHRVVDDNCDFRCTDWSVTLPPEEDDEDAPAVTVTLSDVARFQPAVGIDRMEPNGWAVIGLPANFYARGGASVKQGELFDRPALVRFTPVAWQWDYGDGASRGGANPGASWADLGTEEFSETPTSHVFDEAGDYDIRLTISYRAEYQFAGSGWIPIAGLLPVASNVIEARAVTARTVLVAEDCNENPQGPGC